MSAGPRSAWPTESQVDQAFNLEFIWPGLHAGLTTFLFEFIIDPQTLYCLEPLKKKPIADDWIVPIVACNKKNAWVVYASTCICGYVGTKDFLIHKNGAGASTR